VQNSARFLVSDQKTGDLAAFFRHPGLGTVVADERCQLLTGVGNPGSKTGLVDFIKGGQVIGTESTKAHDERKVLVTMLRTSVNNPRERLTPKLRRSETQICYDYGAWSPEIGQSEEFLSTKYLMFLTHLQKNT
jgi:hypothetical protein